jgi:hypothetical protein
MNMTAINNGEVLQEISIPIFKNSHAQTLARSLTKEKKLSDPFYLARYNAVKEMFHFQVDTVVDYSTRLQAAALADLYTYTKEGNLSRKPGMHIGGYWSAEKEEVIPFRYFLPPKRLRTEKEEGMPLAFYFTFGKEDIFWRGRGHSHFATVWHKTWSTKAGVMGVFPHGGGKEDFLGSASDELPKILDALKHRYPIDSSRVGAYGRSRKAARIIDQLSMHTLPLTHVGLLGPRIDKGDDLFQKQLKVVKNLNPDLKWYVWYGELDKKVPEKLVKKWNGYIEDNGFDVDYRTVPYSFHNAYYRTPNYSFYRVVSGIGE